MEPAVDLPVPPAQAASSPGPTNGDPLEKLLTNFRLTTLVGMGGFGGTLSDVEQHAVVAYVLEVGGSEVAAPAGVTEAETSTS
jgi:hypothetical protein